MKPNNSYSQKMEKYPFLSSTMEITNHNWTADIRPLVSIDCNAYMHENYIQEAIQGLLMQRTNFKVEILIHDDASTDKTPDIIKYYANRYPNLIKATLQIENQYNKNPKTSNYVKPYPKVGKYIARCEGDDYWTDKYKLQKQVDFLEKNPDYVVAYHDAIIVDTNGNIISKSKMHNKSKKDYSKEELIKGNTFILTMSRVHRNIKLNIPPEVRNVVNRDNFFTSLLGHYGKGKYFSCIKPAVYRDHGNGIWSSLDQKQKNLSKIRTYYWMYRYYKRINEKEYAINFLHKINNLLKTKCISEADVVEILNFGTEMLSVDAA